jgi:Glycosyl transferases group 1
MSICNVGYFGSISNAYCLEILNVLASKLPSEKFQLHICGKVDENGPIIASDIQYHGYLSGTEFVSFCDKIDIFINPRCYSSEISDYSFPSKIYEYMSYCRPIVSTPLGHVSDNTSRFIMFSADFSSNAVLKCLIDIEKDYSQYLLKARAHKNYLNGLNVGKKIYNFLEDID